MIGCCKLELSEVDDLLEELSEKMCKEKYLQSMSEKQFNAMIIPSISVYQNLQSRVFVYLV